MKESEAEAQPEEETQREAFWGEEERETPSEEEDSRLSQAEPQPRETPREEETPRKEGRQEEKETPREKPLLLGMPACFPLDTADRCLRADYLRRRLGRLTFEALRQGYQREQTQNQRQEIQKTKRQESLQRQNSISHDRADSQIE